MENVVTIHSDFYIVGVFNLHLDTPSATTTTFNVILASFDTTQHVHFPTHIHGHRLDIIITRSSCKNIQTPTVVDGLSDHNTVIANLKVRTDHAVSKHNVFSRAFHSINIAAFMADITTSNLVTHPREHLSELYKNYHQILNTLLDKHTPIKIKYVSQKPPAPWMTPGIIKSKQRRRYLERVWRKSRSSLDRSRYTLIYATEKCQKQSRIIMRTWYQQILLRQNSYGNASIKVYIGGLLLLYQLMHQSSHCVTKKISSHFKDKISVIQSTFTGHTPDTVHADSPQLNFQLATFEPATTTEVRKIIMSSPSKSCDLDPIPTILLKACLDVLIKPKTDIINASLCYGFFPDDFKCAMLIQFLRNLLCLKKN